MEAVPHPQDSPRRRHHARGRLLVLLRRGRILGRAHPPAPPLHAPHQRKLPLFRDPTQAGRPLQEGLFRPAEVRRPRVPRGHPGVHGLLGVAQGRRSKAGGQGVARGRQGLPEHLRQTKHPRTQEPLWLQEPWPRPVHPDQRAHEEGQEGGGRP